MGFFSTIFSGIRSVGSAVARGATALWEGAKRVAGKVIGWVAEKGEALIGGIKTAWSKVRPHVEKIRGFLIAASAVSPFPWLSTVLTVVERTLGALTAFENSPVAKGVEAALRWFIGLAKRLQQSAIDKGVIDVDATEVDETEEHLEALADATKDASAEARAAFDSVAMIGHLVVAIGNMRMLLEEGEISSLDRYMQLAAMQQLLVKMQSKLATTVDAADFNAEDRFILRVAAALSKGTAELSPEEATELDRIVRRRHRKPLVALVFEGLLELWQARVSEAQAAYKLQTETTTRLRSQLRSLKVAKRLQVEGQLSDQAERELADLEKRAPQAEGLWRAAAAYERETSVLFFSAKGFLQIYQMSPEQLHDAGLDDLAEQAQHAGLLMIQCLQQGKSWSTLSQEEQALVEDFANVFVSLLVRG